MRGAATVLLLLLATGAPAQQGQGSRPEDAEKAAAQEFLAAWRAGDEAAMQRVVDTTEDPVLTAYYLFLEHAEALLAGRRDDDLPAALDAFAHRTAASWSGDVRAMVRRWKAHDLETLRQNLRRQAVLDDVLADLVGGFYGSVLERLASYGDLSREADLIAVRLLQCKGLALGKLRRLDEAEEVLGTAAAAASHMGWRNRQASCSVRRGEVFSVAGRHEESLAAVQEALPVVRERGDARLLCSALSLVGSAHRILGSHERAITAYEETAAVAEEAGLSSWLGKALWGIGDTNVKRGHYRAALEAFEQSQAAYEEAGQQGAVVASLGNQALALQFLGEFDKAIELYEKGLAAERAAGDRHAVANTLCQIGMLHDRLGRYERGHEFLQMARVEAEALGDDETLLYVLGNLALNLERSADLDRAIAMHERVVEMAERLRDRFVLRNILANLALIHTKRREFDAALELLHRCLSEARAVGDAAGVAQALDSIGQAEFARGRPREALPYYRQALEALSGASTNAALGKVLNHLATAHHDLGQHGEAIQAFRRAMELTVAQSRGLGELDAVGLQADIRTNADWGIHTIDDLMRSDASDATKDGFLIDALWFLENSRALMMGQGIAHRRQILDAEVPEELIGGYARASEHVRDAQTRLAVLATLQDTDADRLAEAAQELDGAAAEMREALARIQRASRRAAAVAFPQALPTGEIVAAVPPDTVLVQYQLLGAKPAVALLCTEGSIGLIQLAKSEALADAASSYLELVSVPGAREEALAERLYDLLLRPLEEACAGKQRLMVSPDGILGFLPFDALLRVEGEKRQRALERWEIAYVPSGTAHARLASDGDREAGRGLLALGDPVYPSETAPGTVPAEDPERGLGSLPRLPGTGDEVRALGAMFPDEERALLLRADASRGRLLEALAAADHPFAFLHLACHGHVDAQRPLLSGLVLSGAELFTLHDLYTRHVPADCVVLSACDTGRGSLQPGEGVMGLARGFLLAGARRVVVSNWRVADDATRPLMVSFYLRMREQGMGAGPALRAAKLERLRGGGKLAHPYYWAAFVLWGLPE